MARLSLIHLWIFCILRPSRAVGSHAKTHRGVAVNVAMGANIDNTSRKAKALTEAYQQYMDKYAEYQPGSNREHRKKPKVMHWAQTQAHETNQDDQDEIAYNMTDSYCHLNGPRGPGDDSQERLRAEQRTSHSQHRLRIHSQTAVYVLIGVAMVIVAQMARDQWAITVKDQKQLKEAAQTYLPTLHRGRDWKTRSDRDKLQRKGDGNCFWRSLSHKRWRQTKKELKRRFLLNGHQLPEEQQIQLDAAFKHNHWNNAAAIAYVAAQLAIGINVYMRDKQKQCWRDQCYVETEEPAEIVELAFHNSHYDRLRGGPSSKEIIKRLSQDGTRSPKCGHPRTPPQEEATVKMNGRACQKNLKNGKMARQGKQRRLQGSSKKDNPNPAAAVPPHAAADSAMPLSRGENQRAVRNHRNCRARRSERGPWQSMRLGKAVLALGGAYSGLAPQMMPIHTTIQNVQKAPEDLRNGPAQQDMQRSTLNNSGWNNSRCSEAGNTLRIGLEGGAYRRPSQRQRTQRMIINYEQQQHHIFVPQTWTCATLAEKIPLHFGCHPAWTEIVWNTPTNITLTHNARYPVLSTSTRAQMLKTCEDLIPTATERRSMTHKDLYLGHRASRSHGVTAATNRHRETLIQLNTQLKELLPDACWTTVAVLAHRSVPDTPRPSFRCLVVCGQSDQPRNYL